MPEATLTIPDILQRKPRGEKITMLTAYDFPMARLLDRAGVDLVLVGDSLGMVALGYSSTVPVTLDEMIHHARAVRRGVTRALVVGDMPFMSFNVSREETVRNAGRLMKEAGCDAVKIEWGQGSGESLDSVRALTEAGIPVMGHLGLTPQTAGKLGGFRVQGKTAQTAQKLLEAAAGLEEAGCFAVVLECIPSQVARLITRQVNIPTLGIGAGPDCDGQVLVTHDLLHLTGAFYPKFVRAFARIDQRILKALGEFKGAVRSGKFPAAAESYSMPEEERKKISRPGRGVRGAPKGTRK
ncbi:MAG: 3-methyl-2-oxobutanoate hydroxymethyltransferase [Candidatus Omnitrophica bacterium]|nr:3-methyl-2-oxobutanoate hydroxymethyltransferase [Candidatus Omnitrophota bacterium]